MKRAIMIGAGNIGRGFIGALLEKSGYHVVFADVAEALISAINAAWHIQDQGGIGRSGVKISGAGGIL